MFNTIKCLHKHSSVSKLFKKGIIAPKWKIGPDYTFYLMHSFFFFQIFSNIFLRTTAFNTGKHLKFYPLKIIFSLLQFHSKTSGANTTFSTGWAPHHWSEIHVLRGFESCVCIGQVHWLKWEMPVLITPLAPINIMYVCYEIKNDW